MRRRLGRIEQPLCGTREEKWCLSQLRIQPVEDKQTRLSICPEALLCPQTCIVLHELVTYELKEDKLQVAKVRLLRDEDDPDTLRMVAQSSWPRVLEIILPKVIALLPMDEAASALGRWVKYLWNKPSLLEQIPLPLLRHPNAASLWDQLPALTKCRYLQSNQVLGNCSQEELLSLAWDLARNPSPEATAELLNFPEEILTGEQIWTVLSSERRRLTLDRCTPSKEDGEHLICLQRLALTLDETDLILLRQKFSGLFLKPANRSGIPQDTSIDLAWKQLQSGNSEEWLRLDPGNKLLLVFRWAKDNPTQVFPIAGDKDPFVDRAILLTHPRSEAAPGMDGFQEFHEAIQKLVVVGAFDSDTSVDLRPLLPNCLFEEAEYCDGRAWPDDREKASGTWPPKNAYCAHTRKPCPILMSKNCTKGARVVPVMELSWKNWSLLELLESRGITPCLPELENSQEYVPRLAGWINRLLEIRQRMRCRRCSEVMVTNYQYAKNLAAYRSTVFYCRHGAGHDIDVYLSHCWACDQPIDSRECLQSREGYYLCLVCGSGPRNNTAYKQGSICPKCGLQDSLHPVAGNQRTLICPRCGHQIRLPPPHKMTGPDGRIA